MSLDVKDLVRQGVDRNETETTASVHAGICPPDQKCPYGHHIAFRIDLNALWEAELVSE